MSNKLADLLSVVVLLHFFVAHTGVKTGQDLFFGLQCPPAWLPALHDARPGPHVSSALMCWLIIINLLSEITFSFTFRQNLFTTCEMFLTSYYSPCLLSQAAEMDVARSAKIKPRMKCTGIIL